MPRSIAEIRKANGGLENLTDEDILQSTFQQYKSYYPSLDAYAAEVGYGGAGRGLAGSRISAGIDQYQANLLGLGGAVARGVGAEGVAGAFDRRRQANEAAAAYAQQQAADLGGISDFRDVTGVGSALNYAGGLAAQSLPYAGEAVAGALTGGLALGGTAARMGLSRAAASQAGAVAAGYPSAVGDVLSAQRDAGGERLGAAALGGIPYAALNAIGIEGQLARGLRPIVDVGGSLTRRVAAGAGMGAVGESIGETGQEIVNQVAGRMAVDPNETIFNEEANRRYIDAAVGGATLGGLFGAAGGIRAPRPESGQIDMTQPDTTAEQKPEARTTLTGLDTAALMGSPYANANLLGGGYPNQPLVTSSLYNQEADLTAPAGTTTAAAGVTKPAPSRIFNEDEQKLLSLGINPSGRTLEILPKLLEANLTDEQLDQVRTVLAQNKYKQAEKIIKQAAAQNIINARSASAQGVTDGSTGVSTVQQPAGGLGVGSPVVQGSVGDAGRVAPVAGTVVGGAPAAGAPLQQTGLLPSTAGQPSTTVISQPSLNLRLPTAEQIAADQAANPQLYGPSLQQPTTGALSGTQASQTIQTAPQGQTTTTVPAAAPIKANTTLRLNQQEKLPGETDITNIADIARMTGNAGGIDAVLEEEAGLRADQRDFTEADLNDLIEEQLGKGKNKERDRKILRAYILSRRMEKEGAKGDLVEEIANTFGITEDRVRQIGNPEKLAKLAVEKGFDRNQVFDLLGIESAQKKVATKLGKLEGELTRLKAKAKPSKADTARMAALDEQITRINDAAESGDMATAFKEAGIEGEAGEAFGNLDDAREWQKASTFGSQTAVQLVSIADTLAELKSAAAELKQLGLTQAEAAATARIEELTAEYQAIVSRYEAKPEAEAITPKKGKGKGKAAEKAAEEKDAAKEAEAAKFRAERAAKLQADRNGLAVGDTVINPKLGTGVVKSFAGDGDATTVTVEFKSGQTKELSVKLAKLEKTNAVQVESTASVSVQPKAETSKAVVGQVRRVKKPATESKAQVPAVILTQAEQAAQAWDVVAADFPEAPKFADLTKAQQNTFIGFGEGNWERGDVELELTKMARAAAAKTVLSKRPTGNESVLINAREITADDDIALEDESRVGAIMIRTIDKVRDGKPGRASAALKEMTDWADANNKRLVLMPSGSIAGSKDNLVAWYERNGFVQESDGAMVREPAPTQRAIGREPVTIDVESRIIEETVAPQVAALPAPQVTRLENHYNAKRDSVEFLAKVKADVVLYATKGAEAVAGAIRDIIKSIHAGVLSAAMIFNPTAISQVEAFVVIPQETQTTTTQVLAELPAEVKGMSEAGKQAYATLIPALKGKIGDKFVTIADKPSGRIFVFKANGELVLQQKALFGLAKGDLYKGNNDLKQNRVTPAGLFGINVVDAAKGGDAAKTAGDYDFGKVFALDDPDATVTFMHSVWLKESDAAKRAAALKNDSAADSRYSFGCINVDKETFKDMVGKYSNQMDGSKLFVVPDVQSTVNDFITGNVANDRLVREGVQPVTKTTTTPVKSATKTAGVDRTVVAKEEEIPAPKKPVLFSKTATAPAGKNSVKNILNVFAKLFDVGKADNDYQDFVRVHQTAGDAFRAANKKVPLAQLQNAQAFIDPTDDRVVHLIADNITKGSELAVLLHEVGVHVGLKKQLGANFKILEGQVKSWKNSPVGSLERRVYEAAMARVAAARLDGAITAETAAEELVAYAAEEAALAGVKVKEAPRSRLEAWVKQLHNIATEAFKNFFRVNKVPELSVQDLVNFSFAAAQQQMQDYRTEVGSTADATEAQIVKYYAGAKGSSEGASIGEGGPLNLYVLGTEPFYWDPDEKFGSFTGIGTRAFYERARSTRFGPIAPEYMSMVVTSAESRAFGEQQNSSQDKVLLTVQATLDTSDNTWSLAVFGPENGGELYNQLRYYWKASTTKDNQGNEWTRLEGISRASNMRILSEFRRRLTRLKGGEIPNIDFTRVTGSGAALGDGNYKRYSADELAIRYSKAAPSGTNADMKFGKDAAVAENPYTASELLADIKDFIRADIPGRKLVIVDSINDLLNSGTLSQREVGAALQLKGAYGVAKDGVAYLVADRIQKGEGRAKFMHEVGSHLGLENLLPKATYNQLVNQLEQWAEADNGSLESQLAAKAKARVGYAKTPTADQRDELLAYFVEEAMLAGVDPTASTKESGPLTNWFRTLWAAFKIAMRKLGFKPETLMAKDVVNMAFGAARLEMNGSWHGTAAQFRRFNHAFMSSGEGAQAYGWGTYLAQSVGIAKAYWRADVARKEKFNAANTLRQYVGWRVAESILHPMDRHAIVSKNMQITETDNLTDFVNLDWSKFTTPTALAGDLIDVGVDQIKLVSSKGETRTVKLKAPAGSLMRLDTAVTDDELLNWDASFADQPEVVRNFVKQEAANIKAVREAGVNVQIKSGADVLRYLIARFYKDTGLKGPWGDADPDVKMRVKEQASKYMQARGIKGIRFFDADSRDSTLDNIGFTKDDKTVSGRIGVLSAYFTPGSIVQGYGGPDKIIKFDPEKELVTVIAVDNEGKPRRGERERTHSTMPSPNEIVLAMARRGYTLERTNRTRNLVIFDENDIFRAGSQIGAARQRMKFGSDMVELGKRGQLKEKAGKTRVDTANDRAIKLLEKAAKTKDPAEAEALRAEANALFSATAGKLSGMKFGKNMPSQGLIDRNIAKLPKMSQQPVKRVAEALGDLGGKYLDYAVFTNDLVKRAQAIGLGAAKTFSDRLAARNAKASEEERKIEKIADRYALIEDVNKGSGPGSVNEFLFESTRTGKWGYDTAKFKADPAMKAMFDKLGPKAQQFVKDVFAHGDATLSNKKTIVLNATNSEYDAMIKAAQDLVNTATDSKVKADAEKELAKLKAEKAATLKRFQTLFRIREGIPYSPIKRTGAYVVIGESAEYKAAKAARDTATIKKLESDPDHYHVSFVDTKWQARNLKDNLAEQGVFDSPQIVKRSESFDEAFSGEAMLPALTKMRAAVDRRAQDANGKKDPTAGKLLNIINQLYLEALAEGSARKSEMRRRGVAGEVDMLQSFTQQGRADANFLASVEFEPKIQDALQQMRNQSRTGDRERKSEIFDELTQRYADSLEPKNNPFINGLTNMASKFFLASSPGYYLQNLTQPFMMSLPAMAGRHDYTKAAAALAKAYTELGPLFKDVKLFDQQFDFSKVPDDVREAINDLVNQGKIDIGLATEINEYKVEADGKLSQFAQRLNKGMRLAVQKVEATNRLSTAIAAYRLEFERAKKDPKIADPKAAATQYAADILTETHGDYTAFNAPRAFNTQWGKVALQFRKFQLIQIAFYTKLIRDAFTKPDERAAALKTLGYSLGHTAVFAGMMGLPGYAAIAAIMSAFGDEDEPYDLTAEMRKALGPEWADMIMRGAPTLAGMDLSGKIGAGNMLSIMPFSDADLSTNAGRAEAFGTLMGGAALGMASRVVDGLGLIASGDYYKGIERTMPKGVSDALKAGRQAAEGMTRRNGDVILPDSEISAIDTVMTGLGVPAVKQAVTYERQNRMRDITENFQDRTTRIKNDYTKAVREQDTEAMAEARAAWTKLQQTRQRNGLTPQPVSSLLKAPQEQRAREQRTVGGVQYREGQRKLAESVVEN